MLFIEKLLLIRDYLILVAVIIITNLQVFKSLLSIYYFCYYQKLLGALIGFNNNFIGFDMLNLSWVDQSSDKNLLQTLLGEVFLSFARCSCLRLHS